MSLRWPAAVELVRGSSAMLAAVKAKPGAFGYLSLADAARSGLAVASIDGNAGVVVPSGNAVLAAVNAASWDAVTNAASLDRVRAANAWPLTFVVYALYKPKANNAAAVKRLLADMTIAGQTDVAAASVVSVGQAGLAAAARGIAA